MGSCCEELSVPRAGGNDYCPPEPDLEGQHAQDQESRIILLDGPVMFLDSKLCGSARSRAGVLGAFQLDLPRPAPEL